MSEFMEGYIIDNPIEIGCTVKRRKGFVMRPVSINEKNPSSGIYLPYHRWLRSRIGIWLGSNKFLLDGKIVAIKNIQKDSNVLWSSGRRTVATGTDKEKFENNINEWFFKA